MNFRLQDARLEVLKQLLKKREENHAELNIKRLDKLWTKKQKEKDYRVKKIRNEHIKCMYNNLSLVICVLFCTSKYKNMFPLYDIQKSCLIEPFCQRGNFCDQLSV